MATNLHCVVSDKTGAAMLHWSSFWGIRYNSYNSYQYSFTYLCWPCIGHLCMCVHACSHAHTYTHTHTHTITLSLKCLSIWIMAILYMHVTSIVWVYTDHRCGSNINAILTYILCEHHWILLHLYCNDPVQEFQISIYHNLLQTCPCNVITDTCSNVYPLMFHCWSICS